MLGFYGIKELSSLQEKNYPMAKIPYPKCGELLDKAGFAAWQILVAIFLFPIGLLALIVGTKRTECFKCGYKWYASRSIYII